MDLRDKDKYQRMRTAFIALIYMSSLINLQVHVWIVIFLYTFEEDKYIKMNAFGSLAFSMVFQLGVVGLNYLGVDTEVLRWAFPVVARVQGVSSALVMLGAMFSVLRTSIYVGLIAAVLKQINARTGFTKNLYEWLKKKD